MIMSTSRHRVAVYCRKRASIAIGIAGHCAERSIQLGTQHLAGTDVFSYNLGSHKGG